MAKDLDQDKKFDAARDRYQEIVDKFPTTKAAVEAKDLLDKLKK